MKTLHAELDAYLDARRALGYKLITSEYLLRQFCTWLATRGKAETFTVDDAVAWAREPVNAQPVWWTQRLTAVRPFAAYLNACGRNVPLVPRSLLPRATTRATPFIYSQADVDALLDACPAVFANVRVAATMRAIVGLLVATGIRIGEAVALTVPDLDTGNDVILVRGSKTPLDRLVPLDPTTTAVLVDYLAMPERAATHPDPDGPVFVTYKGTGFGIEMIEQYFKRLTRAAGLTPRGRARPRLHDLRHTFATAHMAAAYQDRGDPQLTLSLLTTWLGHTQVAHTYWYLSATPQLMAMAAERLQPTARTAGES
ncbi:tyrosine-type recombinase/integrase [Ornithinimicrobium murale]|uniref:tyrosine-type recombinase/integrase n=1 Tax=Ornithinimicrobium murale TaxID=1050153 RepID=UPI000E0D03E2|nr:tyrosine-type recombinase/integrase [Ornithinimicrobium murale]